MNVRATRAKKLLPLTNSRRPLALSGGCGSAFSKTLYQNNVLVVKGDDHCMIDCGSRTPEALSRLGRPVTDISNWLITHSHADHVGGLEEVMLMGRYVAGRKPNVVITAEYEKVLWNFSLKGGSEFNEVHDGEGSDSGTSGTSSVPSGSPGTRARPSTRSSDRSTSRPCEPGTTRSRRATGARARTASA